MALLRLDIEGVRNLQQVTLRDLGRVNIIQGSNGSGKTSLLEAIYLLGVGQSFRTAHIKSCINHQKDSFAVYGEVASAAGARRRVGVSRDRSGETVAKIDGQKIRSRSALASTLPLQVMHAASFDILCGGPGVRRQFLDWGVFHVEPPFFRCWQRFQRAIKQRNTLLRHGNIDPFDLAPWDRELAENGTAIHESRVRYLDNLRPVFNAVLGRIAPELGSVELKYRAGWDTQHGLLAALELNRQTDVQQGYTRAGPQRADVRVLCEDGVAAEVLSRGQQKMVVCALKLAQGCTLAQAGAGECTYLVDDLSAELDYVHYRRVALELAEMQAQVFVTCVNESDVRAVWPEEWMANVRTFHVERGQIMASKPLSPTVAGSGES
jgi:DNA replication and repair protein RecF